MPAEEEVDRTMYGRAWYEGFGLGLGLDGDPEGAVAAHVGDVAGGGSDASGGGGGGGGGAGTGLASTAVGRTEVVGRTDDTGVSCSGVAAAASASIASMLGKGSVGNHDVFSSSAAASSAFAG